jgi:hypothetical protein
MSDHANKRRKVGHSPTGGVILNGNDAAVANVASEIPETIKTSNKSNRTSRTSRYQVGLSQQNGQVPTHQMVTGDHRSDVLNMRVKTLLNEVRWTKNTGMDKVKSALRTLKTIIEAIPERPELPVIKPLHI